MLIATVLQICIDDVNIHSINHVTYNDYNVKPYGWPEDTQALISLEEFTLNTSSSQWEYICQMFSHDLLSSGVVSHEGDHFCVKSNNIYAS